MGGIRPGHKGAPVRSHTRPAIARTMVAIAAVLIGGAVLGAIAPSAALAGTGPMKIPVPISAKAEVSVCGDIVVWEDGVDFGDPVNRNILGCNIATSEPVTICAAPRDQRAPRVSGNTVIWQDSRSIANGSDIWMCDLTTMTESAVCTLPGSQMFPEIDGDYVVWEGVNTESVTKDLDIYGKNLRTGETFTVVEKPGDQLQADVGEGWVVYTDASTGNGDIRAYEIATGTTYTLCAKPKPQRAPRIGEGGLVVWEDQRNQVGWPNNDHFNIDIYGCSVYDRIERAFATGPTIQQSARAAKNMVFYLDRTNGTQDLLTGLDLLSGSRFGVKLATGGVNAFAPMNDGRMAWAEQSDYIGIPNAANVYVSSPTEFDVVAGADRYTTSVRAEAPQFPDGAETVVLTTGANWPDALAGAGLSGSLDAPLLLTASAALPASIATELTRLHPKNIVILGGEGSVSAHVFDQAAAMVGAENVRRIGGIDRYATATNIAEELTTRPTWDGTVIVASGSGFADALAAAPVAVKYDTPLVLSGPKGLSAAAQAVLQKPGVKEVVVVGGSASVSDATYASIAKLAPTATRRRLSGLNRYSTASSVASWAVASRGMAWNGLGVASGTTFPDALVGGIAKGRSGSVLLLTDGAHLSPATRTTLIARGASIRAASYIGGTGSVTKTVRSEVRTALK